MKAYEAKLELEPAGGVALDSLFSRIDVPNSSGMVTSLMPDGQKFTAGSIAMLKVTPSEDGDATLKALIGAKSLLESGRVKCLVTSMNFDLNSTEALIAYFAE